MTNDYNNKTSLPTQAADFSFPYDAYQIQVDFMKSMYNAIDQKRIGIFESPTGTGKSLSIICSALTWLVNNSNNEGNGPLVHDSNGSGLKRGRQDNSETLSSSDDDEPAWIKEQDRQIRREEEREKLLREQEKQERRKDRVDLYQQKRAKFLHGAFELAKKEDMKKKRNNNNQLESSEDDSDLLLTDYEDSTSGKSLLNSLNIGIKGSMLDDLFSSDEEEEMAASKKKRRPNSIFAEDDEDDNPDSYITPKIIYCSRTHTQLSQFVQEIQKTSFVDKVRLVSLASRKQMCIHPTVSKVQSQNRVNELCLDMKNKKDKKHKCPYDDQSGFKLFKDHVLIKIRDIEDLANLGKRIEACAYYGSRKAVPHAQVIVLPYSSLIHQATRESLGIKLEDCTVIIDEAHNLVDAVIHSHSFQITQAQVQQCHDQLSAYFTKYQARLKVANQDRVKQLLGIMDNILKFFRSGVKGAVHSKDSSDQLIAEVLNLNDFSFRTNTDSINMFHVCEFIEKSELTKKLNGFIDRRTKTSTTKVAIHTRGSEQEDSVESGIHAFNSFLLALTNMSKDGRILVEINKTVPSKSLIKFVLLNPSIYFKEIVDKARSVILAGGTMEPISSVIQQLFPEHKGRIQRFQCGHVIPDENILPICLMTSSSSEPFDFTYQSRSKPSTMNDLGLLITNLCNIVPDGIVVFFPSYAYESAVFDYWSKNDIIRRIEMKKKFFREPKSATEVDSVLADYKRTIDKSIIDKDKKYSFKGAVLSCVVGGKMSEGINFSDGYGRLVVVVGLPYPNSNDMELKEKMNYLNSLQPGSGNDYYEDLCMKAVNQSIGRAIRHAKDYATILLVDKRYSKSTIQAKFPNWIRTRVQTCHQFGPAFGQIARFFKSKESQMPQPSMALKTRNGA